MNKTKAIIMGMAALLCMPMTIEAQNTETLSFKGLKNTMRYDDGEDSHTKYLGNGVFEGDQGTWNMAWDGSNVTASLDHYENLMYGNSGAFYMNGKLYTIMSHESPNEDEEVEFVVRSFDTTTFEKLSEKTFKKSANLESRGLAFNPIDKKVYGLFYFTDVTLPVSVDELDQEDVQEGYTTDAGYALATVDLETMELTQITPGVYYDNFVFLACNPEGRLFSMTSGGTLCEFDAKTGLMLTKDVVDEEGNTYQESIFEHSGQQSQFKRQSACFDYTTGKLYWNGYINSGKGINDWGSWSTLSDKEWRTNGKYDTALYEVDINTGKATRLGLIPNRLAYSCMWIPGHDATELTGIEQVKNETTSGNISIFNTSGQLVYSGSKTTVQLESGLYIVKQGNKTKKIAVK